MGAQTVQFFADVGPDGQQHRLLMQPLRIEGVGVFDEKRDFPP